MLRRRRRRNAENSFNCNQLCMPSLALTIDPSWKQIVEADCNLLMKYKKTLLLKVRKFKT